LLRRSLLHHPSNRLVLSLTGSNLVLAMVVLPGIMISLMVGPATHTPPLPPSHIHSSNHSTLSNNHSTLSNNHSTLSNNHSTHYNSAIHNGATSPAPENLSSHQLRPNNNHKE
ncbi:hypothetical protein OTU49_010564, partial [Cherax quadricarinatus]